MILALFSFLRASSIFLVTQHLPLVLCWIYEDLIFWDFCGNRSIGLFWNINVSKILFQYFTACLGWNFSRSHMVWNKDSLWFHRQTCKCLGLVIRSLRLLVNNAQKNAVNLLDQKFHTAKISSSSKCLTSITLKLLLHLILLFSFDP